METSGNYICCFTHTHDYVVPFLYQAKEGRSVANVIKLFSMYVTISLTSVKIIGKYAASGVTYVRKVL
jgi:hypothetical protein